MIRSGGTVNIIVAKVIFVGSLLVASSARMTLLSRISDAWTRNASAMDVPTSGIEPRRSQNCGCLARQRDQPCL
jgi:hypothetical protein